jgi:hypothetical protein
MRRAAFLGIATLLFGATAAFAQENFSGHWVEDVLSNGPPADGGGGRARGGSSPTNVSTFGNDFRLVQDGKTLTIKRWDTTYADSNSNVFNLDGTETKNLGLFTNKTNPGPTVATTKWEGKKLLITTTGGFIGAANGATGVTTTLLWMQGGKLYIQTVRPGNNGSAANGTTILAIFKKKN